MFDPCHGNNLIDANVLHRTGGPEGAAVDEILRLHDEGAFTILLPHSVKAALEHPNTPIEVRQKAEGFVHTEPVELTDIERTVHREIAALIPGKDALRLFEAAKYGRCFITLDEPLLKNADEISELLSRVALSLKILKPSEFLEAYRHAPPPRRKAHRA